MKILRVNCSILTILLFFLSGEIWAQGPEVSYYYNQATELSFASCYLYLEGGSCQKIPFLPVVSKNYQRAPLGVKNYTQDVSVEGLLVFIGNGIVKEGIGNSYYGRRYDYTPGEIEVKGKVVMFCYDFPAEIGTQLKEEFPLERRISEAASRGARAVILFSLNTDFPFLLANYQKESEIPDIPVITITKQSAYNILESSGLEVQSVLEQWEKSGTPLSAELISRVKLNIKGKFEAVETENFLIRFRKEVIPEAEIKKIVKINEQSLTFLFEVLKEERKLTWKKQLAVYFRDFDSKIFYTHHWGAGLASHEGVFLIYKDDFLNYSLAVHENTHILVYLNWTQSPTSFLNEGMAKYTEALATKSDKNHRQTITFLTQGKLFPLEEMVNFTIGFPGIRTTVAYPASGSFVAFLIEKYGLMTFKRAFLLEARPQEEKREESSWEKVYEKPLSELEKEWLRWLGERYPINKEDINNHIKEVEKMQQHKYEKRKIALPLKELEKYTGTYFGREMGRQINIKIKEDKLLFSSPDTPELEVWLIPEGDHTFQMEGGFADGELLVFTLDEAGKVIKACFGPFCFEKE